MSQLGGQQFLFPNKPFTPINVSGIDAGQATASLGQTRQGELNRAFQGQQNDLDRQAAAAQNEQQVALQQQQMQLQAEQQEATLKHQEWIKSQAELERTNAEKRSAASAKAGQALINKRNAWRTGDQTATEALDLELTRYQGEYADATRKLELMSPIAAIFNEQLTPEAVRPALETYVNDYLGGRFTSYGTTVGALKRGVATALAELASYEEPIPLTKDTMKADMNVGRATFHAINPAASAALGGATALSKAQLPTPLLPGTTRAAVAGTQVGAATVAGVGDAVLGPVNAYTAGAEAPRIIGQRLAEAVSLGRSIDKGATDTAPLQQLFENVMRAATNPAGASDASYFQSIKDAVNTLTQPGADGKMGPWSRTELDAMVRSASLLLAGGSEALRNELVGEDLQTLYAKMEETEGADIRPDMSKFGADMQKFMSDTGQAWGAYAEAMGGEIDHSALNFSKSEMMQQLSDGLVSIMNDPTMGEQDYVKAFDKMPTELREKVVHGLISRSDLFMSRLSQNPELVRMLQTELNSFVEGASLDTAGLGGLGRSLTGALGTQGAAQRTSQGKMDEVSRRGSRLMDNRQARDQESEVMQEALTEFIYQGGDPDNFFKGMP